MIAAFTLALGAGMIGGTPGGVGPFELALITVLPGAATPELAAALIAFRMVYYAIPCVAGAAYAFLTPPWRQPERVADTLPARGPRAELGIAAQNDFRLIESFHAEGVALRTPQSLTLFLGATHGSIAALLAPLSRAALAENRLPCIYKLTARDAALVRRAGWHVVPFAVEAVIDPQRFSLDGSDSRQLRRFLRKAETSGLEVREITDPDWEAMTEIHCAWEESHGRERGLTMGRFCPLYLRDKPLFGAYHGGRLIAFTSWLEAPGTLSLDVLRHEKDLPQGTMHALIHGVIAQARAQGLTEVNLAALPHPSLPERLRDCAGLTRFKTSFAPAWRPLYIAAPNAAYLAVAAADIRLAIIEPTPLTRSEEDLWDLDALIDSAMLPEHFSEQFTDEIDLAHLAPEVPELRRAG
jgi:phosphatidylglycerol lysyltransferase